MNKKLLKYQLPKEALNMIVTSVALMAVCLTCDLFFKLSGGVSTIDYLIPIWLIIFCADSVGLGDIQRYAVFGFSRKQFFKYRALCLGMRSVIAALVRSLLRSCYFETYISEYIADGVEHTEQMQPVSFVLLLLTNICFFFSIYMLLMIDRSTRLRAIAWFSSHRMSEAEKTNGKKHPVIRLFVAICGLAVVVAMICLDQDIYMNQMIRGLPYQWCVLSLMAAVSAVLYFMASWRYQPKYIEL